MAPTSGSATIDLIHLIAASIARRRGRDLDRAVVLDVDLGAGLFHDLADHLAAGADHFADLVGRDLDGLDARREFAQLGAGAGQRLGHLAQDVHAAVLGLAERDLHDLLGDAGDLDVHLQRGDAVFGAGHLEVHVAEVIFVAQDVGEHGEAVAFEDQAHGDAGHRRFSGTPASISASEVPQTVAIEDEPFDSVISETTRIV
jgi:hypothetical protein